MRNLLLRIRFNGSRYHGYQVQKNAVAVSQVFQKALHTVLGHETEMKGCSRTDTGVHANMFCISFHTDNPIAPESLVRGLNIELPPDIAVVSCEEVDDEFHARYSCTGKRYLDKVLNSEVKDPFLQDQAYLYKNCELDAPKLQRIAQGFLGTHDFSSFCNAGSKIEDFTRTIYEFKVWREGNMVYFSVTGDGFLYNMVRIMVGTLIAIGFGKLPEDSIPKILAAKNRLSAGPTAPACGLYLDEVFYSPIGGKEV